jgi:hypothetical protein
MIYYWLVWFIQNIILYGIQAGILLSAQTLAAQGTQARRARLRRALTEAANSDTVPIIKTVQNKNTHTHNTIILNTHVYGLSGNYVHRCHYYWTHIQIAQVFAHLRLLGHLAINFKCTSFECNTLYTLPHSIVQTFYQWHAVSETDKRRFNEHESLPAIFIGPWLYSLLLLFLQ